MAFEISTPNNRGEFHSIMGGERKAIIDPLEWKKDSANVEWPHLANGTVTRTAGKGHF